MITISKVNEVFVHVDTDRGTLQEMADRFSFKVPGYQFMPKYKAGVWDGTLRLFNPRTQLLHIGLLDSLKDFALEEDYEIHGYDSIIDKRNVSREDLLSFIELLSIPERIEPRDYQIDAVLTALNERRKGFLSPTSSGKSLIIYIITRFILATKKKVLIIVPTTQLVSQMASDFREYNNWKDLSIHEIMAGVDKTIDAKITISTWQSLFRLPRQWFDKFDCVIGDEAHLFQAKSLTTIMENLHNAKDRFAFTGTLNGTAVTKLQIESLFGQFTKVTTTEQLMKDGHISKLNIKAVVLKYTAEECKMARANRKYNDEINYINSHTKRNKFIINLIEHLKGNTLVLFKRIDTHGEILFKMLKEKANDEHEIFFVAGKTPTEDRETIRKYIDTHQKSRCTIVGSSGTMSTGTNIKKIQNIIFVSPTKSRITTLQSVGRGLRLDGDTNECTLYDIADDLRIGSYTNHTMKHFFERVKMYDEENFDYKITVYPM